MRWTRVHGISGRAIGCAELVGRTARIPDRGPAERSAGPLLSQGYSDLAGDQDDSRSSEPDQSGRAFPGRLRRHYLAAAYFSATLPQFTTFHQAET